MIKLNEWHIDNYVDALQDIESLLAAEMPDAEKLKEIALVIEAVQDLQTPQEREENQRIAYLENKAGL